MGGFMDKAKEIADQHDEQVDQGLEKAGDFADQKTGGKYGSQIDQGRRRRAGAYRRRRHAAVRSSGVRTPGARLPGFFAVRAT